MDDQAKAIEHVVREEAELDARIDTEARRTAHALMSRAATISWRSALESLSLSALSPRTADGRDRVSKRIRTWIDDRKNAPCPPWVRSRPWRVLGLRPLRARISSSLGSIISMCLIAALAK